MPEFNKYPAIRTVSDKSLGAILKDIEQHIPAQHSYRNEADKINWAHEATHGINSLLRNIPEFASNKRQCLYVLADNFWVVENNSDLTIQQIGSTMPVELRGSSSFKTYFIDSIGDWGRYPAYLFDEWVAFTNGLACGLDLAHLKLWYDKPRISTTTGLAEFNYYSLWSIYISSSNYQDLIRPFVQYQFNNANALIEYSQKYDIYNSSSLKTYLNQVNNSKNSAVKTFLDWLANYVNIKTDSVTEQSSGL